MTTTRVITSIHREAPTVQFSPEIQAALRGLDGHDDAEFELDQERGSSSVPSGAAQLEARLRAAEHNMEPELNDLAVSHAPNGALVRNPPTHDFGSPNRHLLFFLAFFLSPELREARLGDAQEQYTIHCKRFGVRQANSILARDVLAAIFCAASRMIEGPISRILRAFRG
jgi:hypothetical protein